MTDDASRILFLFRYPVSESSILNASITHYRHSIERGLTLPLKPIEYFVLIVYRSLPSYSLHNPGIITLHSHTAHQAEKAIMAIGKRLGIAVSHQYIAEGHADSEARRLAAHLHIDTVVGYSTRYARWFYGIDRLRHFWHTTVRSYKKPVMQKVSVSQDG